MTRCVRSYNLTLSSVSLPHYDATRNFKIGNIRCKHHMVLRYLAWYRKMMIPSGILRYWQDHFWPKISTLRKSLSEWVNRSIYWIMGCFGGNIWQIVPWTILHQFVIMIPCKLRKQGRSKQKHIQTHAQTHAVNAENVKNFKKLLDRKETKIWCFIRLKSLLVCTHT